MKGELDPLILAARYTSFLGPGTHTTAPVDVSNYDHAAFEFWRGNLAGTSATFKTYFEQADEPGPDPAIAGDPPEGAWFQVGSTITTANASELITFDLTMRYLRMRVYLTTYEAAITLFAVGSIRKRIPNIG
jgi:hypothetical protein